ncbi:MAG: lipoyl(octanoyl) transferase LipB [Bacteroidales bacterium]
MELNFNNAGLCDYKEMWSYQQKVHDSVKSKKLESGKPTSDHEIIFVEHPHVYTLGKRGDEHNLLVQEAYLEQLGAQLFRIDRGGDITYHGPGQLVCYPIIDLEFFKMGVKAYVDFLEESVIRVLSQYSIIASRKAGATGVWLDVGSVGARKICAIGVKVSRGVTMHGLALNVNTDNSYFQHINPCGFNSNGVTSMEKELGRVVSMEEVTDSMKQEFRMILE